MLPESKRVNGLTVLLGTCVILVFQLIKELLNNSQKVQENLKLVSTLRLSETS